MNISHRTPTPRTALRWTLSTGLALLMALPALGLARPPDDIARHRQTLEALSVHPDAASVSRELAQLRSWIDAANTQWRKGDESGLELTLVRLEAQEELVRARMQAAKARAALQRTVEERATVAHQIEAERSRYEAMRAFLEGEE